MREALHTLPVTNCLLYGIAEHNADILNRVMIVDLRVALAGHLKVEQAMHRHMGQQTVTQ